MEKTPGISIALLEALLDAKEMTGVDKTIVRNIMIPALEHIETAPTPQECMKRAYLIVALMSVPVAIAMDCSISREAHNRISASIVQTLYNDIGSLLSMLYEAFDAKSNMDNTNNNANTK